MDTPEQRYTRDPIFKHFVDVIESMLHKAEMSPSEVREGAMLACIYFEMRRPLPTFEDVRGILKDDAPREGGEDMTPDEMRLFAQGSNVPDHWRIAAELCERLERLMTTIEQRNAVFVPVPTFQTCLHEWTQLTAGTSCRKCGATR